MTSAKKGRKKGLMGRTGKEVAPMTLEQ